VPMALWREAARKPWLSRQFSWKKKVWHKSVECDRLPER